MKSKNIVSENSMNTFKNEPKIVTVKRSFLGSFVSFFIWGFLCILALVLTGAIVGVGLVGIAYAVGYANLAEKSAEVQISKLTEYQPRLPMKVFTADGILIGEYGTERRIFVSFKDTPQVMVNAILAVEDTNFFKHPGVDPKGVLRAIKAKLENSRTQGASTITMQVARNFFLTTEQTYERKFYEMLISLEIERSMSKEQILEVYMNHIYLGQRAYGFGEAAETYFGKKLKDITLAEAAILAGLPQAPSDNNPIKDMKGTKERQLHVLNRMLVANFITQEQYNQAEKEPITLKKPTPPELKLHAEYAADFAQQMVLKELGDNAYISGLNIYTTILSEDQKAGYRAVRDGVMVFERRKRYRGPLDNIVLPKDEAQFEKALAKLLEKYPDDEDLKTAIIISAEPKKVILTRNGKEHIEITGDGLEPIRSGLAANAAPGVKIQPGSVVRILLAADPNKPKADPIWFITQDPEVEAALVATDTHTGAIRAMVGGFNFSKNKFNHAVQAWRQPGSSFKPFIYSAALEKGVTPLTGLADVAIEVPTPGGRTWLPRNYGGKHTNTLVPVYAAIAKSMNIPAILVIDAITPEYAQQWIARFGFAADKNPPYLTLVLGAGSATPLQMASAYSVFANGGYLVPPHLISRITDAQGNVIYNHPTAAPAENQRAISERNAFVMSSLLRQVITSGTGSRAQQVLKRNDIYGKSGTTNNAYDVWFAGYSPSIAAVAWVGYDTPKELGSNEQGGRLALPIWIDYMKVALTDVPQQPIASVKGVSHSGGQAVYDEFARGGGIQSIGSELLHPEAVPGEITSGEQGHIIDMFR